MNLFSSFHPYSSGHLTTLVSLSWQLVHGPCSKTRVAYILSLLREQHPNNTTVLEEEEESDEEGDITMFDHEVNTLSLHSETNYSPVMITNCMAKIAV